MCDFSEAVYQSPCDRVNEQLKAMGLDAFEAVTTTTAVERLASINREQCEAGFGTIHNQHVLKTLPDCNVTITRYGLYPIYLEDLTRELHRVLGDNKFIGAIKSVECFTRSLMR